jgi:hypothetical protein
VAAVAAALPVPLLGRHDEMARWVARNPCRHPCTVAPSWTHVAADQGQQQGALHGTACHSAAI